MAEVAVAEVKRNFRMISDDRMKEAEFLRRDWVVNAEQGTTVADVEEPLYWTHMANRMDAYDRIEVRLETGEWIWEGVVLFIDGQTVHVKCLQLYELAGEARKSDSSLYEANFGGPHHRWRVIRKGDGVVLEKGLSTRAAANEWIAHYERSTARMQ